MNNLTSLGRAAETLEEERKEEGGNFYSFCRISKRKAQIIKPVLKNRVHH